MAYYRVTFEGKLENYKSLEESIDPEEYEDGMPNPMGQMLADIDYITVGSDRSLDFSPIVNVSIEEIPEPKNKSHKRERRY